MHNKRGGIQTALLIEKIFVLIDKLRMAVINKILSAEEYERVFFFGFECLCMNRNEYK